MRLTGEHAEFFRQRRAPMPKWAQGFLPRARVSIDTCIAHHANAPRETDSEREIGNTLAILQLIAKRIERSKPTPELRAAILRDELQRMARETHNSAKRQAIARKWEKRLARQISERYPNAPKYPG